MQENRISFAKDKIGTYIKGASGITATTESASKVIGQAEINSDGTYSSSNLLNQNIDKLAQTLGFNFSSEVEPENINDSYQGYSSLTEQEIINNLDEHLDCFNNNSSSTYKNDNFCRQCGSKYISKDNFCGNCGNKRI
jgi:hypothetical protein